MDTQLQPTSISQRSVLIRISGRDSRKVKNIGRPSSINENGATLISVSGVMIDNTTILTTGCLLGPFLYKENEKLLLQKDAKIEVRFESEENGTTWFPVQLADLIQCPGVGDTLKSLIGHGALLRYWDVGWFSHEPAQRPVESDLNWYTYDCIAVLKLKDKADFMPQFSPLRSPPSYQRGTSVLSVSSPHGLLHPEAFLNYLHSGIISNVFFYKDSPCVLMTDVSCLPGSEGGALYDRDNNFIGIQVPPIRKRGTNTYAYLSIASKAFLPALEAYMDTKFKEEVDIDAKLTGFLRIENEKIPDYFAPNPLLPPKVRNPTVVEQTCLRVPLIMVGSSWGSGVIISPLPDCYILTSGHLLKPFIAKDSPSLKINARIKVRLPSHPQKWQYAECLFVSNQSHSDIAILKLELSPELKDIDIPYVDYFTTYQSKPKAPVSLRQAVFAVGHGLLTPNENVRAGVTSGIVSKLVTDKTGAVVVVATSCDVHTGASGGMLVDATTGEFIGLITQNTVQTDGVVLPKLNGSLPGPFLSKYLCPLVQGEGIGKQG
eukprot:TRINITY_DN4643_c0_g1_i4.p1 TRINITY_DN4643_c0_g1~~TRINITY_DN4643_c0_g1_i4.p1  ORF type:complete len:558 (+),score=62.73 TRINITY_DN4643_c0_g1_i4:37-1674(+)